MAKQGRLTSRGASHRGSRRVKLVSRMEAVASVNQAADGAAKANIREAGDDQAPAENASLAPPTTEDPIDAKEGGRVGDAPRVMKEAISTSTMLKTEGAVTKSTFETLPSNTPKDGRCLNREENDTINNLTTCRKTEVVDNSSSIVSSVTVARTKGTSKSKDPTSKKKVSWGLLFVFCLQYGCMICCCSLKL